MAKVEFGRPDIERLLRRMALLAQALILRRAFPDDGSPARSVTGSAVRPLARDYGWYKSGTRPYLNDSTKAAADRTRARSGKPGPGPLVNLLGIRTRLAPRPNVSNQRLSDSTAKGLGVVREVPGKSITLGFRDARSQRVAVHLEERNRFWGLDEQERDRVLMLAAEAARDLAQSFKISGKVTIVANVRLR